ncbi:MAG: hypothetical protein ACLF0G_05780 [Candidatus Brocadiia bacterium]
MTRVLSMASVAAAALALAAPARAAGAEVVTGFAAFQLEVTGARVEARLSDREGHTARPQAGEKLVVVSLRGKAAKASNPVYAPGEFGLITEQRTRVAGAVVIVRRFHPCVAIRLGEEGEWTVAQPDLLSVTGFVSAGTFQLEVAARLPREAAACTVVVPTLAGGQASLPRGQPASGEPEPPEAKEVRLTVTGSITNMAEAKEYIEEDSYLQLVRLPADGRLEGRTDGRGRLTYTSDLPRVDIPADGRFTFRIPALEPGRYLLVAQRLKAFGLGRGGTPFLARAEDKKLAIVTVPEKEPAPEKVDLGRVFIPVP